MKVIGVERKKGTYQDMPYDNYMIYCTETMYSGEVAGDRSVSVKIKATDFIETMQQAKISKVADLLGRDIEPVYNRYGKCQGFYFKG